MVAEPRFILRRPLPRINPPRSAPPLGSGHRAEFRKSASLSPSEHNVPARNLSAIARASRPTQPSARFLETSENSPCWYASCFLPDRQLSDCRKQRGSNYDTEEDAMRRDLRRTFLMPALLALLAFVAAPLFGATALAADATLYELTENMRLVGKDSPRRRATSELMGTANAGTPLCPMPVGAPPCTINATGSDNISLVTGLGKFGGTFTVVVQGDNPVDSPEFVVAKGKFTGKMDFSPAVLGGIPYGSVVGTLDPNGGGHRDQVRFTGTFFLPFAFPSDPSATAYYLDFNPANPYHVVPVADNQRALGYPTVKFEINF